MNNERDIQTMLARTRPATILPEYARPPAPMPNAPSARKDVWLAEVKNGLNLGQSYKYPIAFGEISGVYLDEVNPQTLASFYPSRTRDASNVHNGLYGINIDRHALGTSKQWPVLFVLRSPNLVWVLTLGAVHYFSISIEPVPAEVVSIDDWGWPNVIKWTLAEVTYSFYLSQHFNFVGSRFVYYYAYPPAVVGDIITVTAGATAQAPNGAGRFFDLTPRIPIKYSGTKPGTLSSHVQVDPAIPGLWTVDNI